MRYILWPIKRKYGQSISWADLIILAGNVAIESMMGPWGTVQPLWYGGGRVDAFAPEEDVYWGHEPEWLKDDRHEKVTAGDRSNNDTGLEKPLRAVQMGLIYVNPVSIYHQCYCEIKSSLCTILKSSQICIQLNICRRVRVGTQISFHQQKIYVKHSAGWV